MYHLHVEIESDEAREDAGDEYWSCPINDCQTEIRYEFIYNIKRHAFSHGEVNYYYRMSRSLLILI